MTTSTPTRLEPGADAPDFTLTDQDGNAVSLSDYRGKRVILYTYPEAFTPGCTAEACDFRESDAPLRAAGYTILGISSDDPEKLAEFRDAEHLDFTLLSDADHAVQTAYGAYGERNKYGRVAVGPIRSTFVINEHGKITEALYNVRAAGHVARILKLLGV
ncbi:MULTISPECIES: thioredoxin-dependent thiol peroxidase [unclassified Pseudoclavibacter]|uniref:thioredoxin-dependent thiol peroxidase n=1 Tax=unclassified Pseudoclavibacter TaxID=2615177 RepID=UPI001BA93E78|nr:thioredoxin-dependent thiol peroxidase [Pseudoclavibacter sp. Marseille-Q4354]MBS3178474.1 thioredoxin-dependent thiol peroxidase [Pseudoclavibacter sp. Marseille-Q4354]